MNGWGVFAAIMGTEFDAESLDLLPQLSYDAGILCYVVCHIHHIFSHLQYMIYKYTYLYYLDLANTNKHPVPPKYLSTKPVKS